MSNCLINIRFGEWHLQVATLWPPVRISWNSYHVVMRKIDPTWRWFEVYQFFGFGR